MASAKLLEIMKQADELSVDEKLTLASHLIEKAREGGEAQPRRKWNEIKGSAPYPMVGEDAQAWISRNREESERQFSQTEIKG
ncbi:MAG: hypothetical protein ABIQ44_02485 [Chloroflexia bacterium]